MGNASLSIRKDLVSGLVVFFVALPLCLGIALASNAPLFSGILAGIIGGVLVGALSGSSTSVSGPAAGLTAVVAAELIRLGSFEAFLVAVIIAGAIQVALGLLRMGFIAGFFPSSVIKGLLWAIGLILILKQVPHLLGHDPNPMGDEAFLQADSQNTFSELVVALFKFHYGAAIIGIVSILLLVICDRIKAFKSAKALPPIGVIVLAIVLSALFPSLDAQWSLSAHQLVQVPVSNICSFLTFPNFSALQNLDVYRAAITVALVASLETLLNLEALDKIDPLKRRSPPNRELFAQGVGNMAAGFVGGLPLTSVVVRSSVNINAGAQTKLSAIVHGAIIFITVLLIPEWLNKIPLSALAAILIVTGFKLASPRILIQLWKEGKYQFLPFIITVVAIVMTDLLIGILIGLGVAVCFILHSNIRFPIKKRVEKHATGHRVLHVELPNQVSFLNRAALEMAFKTTPAKGHLLINAQNTDYIDPDILDLIDDFQSTAFARDIKVSLLGFKDKYPELSDRIEYVDFTTRELQRHLTPEKVLEILKEGNARFREGIRLTRSLERQLKKASTGQFPLAVVLSCIDSRAPVELLFDLGIGDVFTVRIAGNVVSHEVLGSVEFSSAVAGAKLVVVMGHTACGAIKAAVDFANQDKTGYGNLDSLIAEIQESIDKNQIRDFDSWSEDEKERYLTELSRKNVMQSISQIRKQSPVLKQLEESGKILVVGAIYNIASGEVTFLP
jgi:MFS superfamily sulfate permease-like transporter